MKVVVFSCTAFRRTERAAWYPSLPRERLTGQQLVNGHVNWSTDRSVVVELVGTRARPTVRAYIIYKILNVRCVRVVREHADRTTWMVRATVNVFKRLKVRCTLKEEDYTRLFDVRQRHLCVNFKR